jgi:hypothetical protein
MSPTILQLQSIGIQDVYLTRDPQINIFKYTYYRYANFATEIVQLPLNEVATFGKRAICQIEKRGHLLSKLYLHIKLPQLNKVDGQYLSWTNSIGHAIFSEPIELEINGVIVDKLYPQFLDIWDEFSNSSKQLGRNLMLGKSDVYIANFYNAQKPLDLIIPLEFWFTKNYSSALPLLSMPHQNIQINFKFRNFNQLINYDGTAPPSEYFILDSMVYAEYVYIDDVILDKFQRQKHMYVIEQAQYHGDEMIPTGTSIYNTTLKFNHTIKELFFCCVEKNNVDNNNYFVYSNSDDNPIISSAALLLEGKKRLEYLPEVFYRTIFPDSVHSVIPLKYIYCIPFSIRPEDNQPTGSINMSRFNDIVLSLKINQPNQDCYLYVYAINYNILTIENGNFTLEFAV